MKLAPFHKIADVLAGAPQQLACSSRVRYAMGGIALKITISVCPFPIQAFCIDIKILSPCDSISNINRSTF